MVGEFVVTEARVKLVDHPHSKIVGSVSITICDAFVVHGLKVITGSNGLFVSMPQRKIGDDYRNTCYPIKREIRDQIEAYVLEEYKKAKQDAPSEEHPEIAPDDNLPF